MLERAIEMPAVAVGPPTSPEPVPVPPHDPLILKTLLDGLEQGGPERVRMMLVGSAPKTHEPIFSAQMRPAPRVRVPVPEMPANHWVNDTLTTTGSMPFQVWNPPS